LFDHLGASNQNLIRLSGECRELIAPLNSETGAIAELFLKQEISIAKRFWSEPCSITGMGY
jgi:hypothetical protein